MRNNRLDEGIISRFVDQVADMWYRNQRSAKLQRMIDRNPELERELDNIARSRENAEEIIRRLDKQEDIF